jgi:hypothetical protein
VALLVASNGLRAQELIAPPQGHGGHENGHENGHVYGHEEHGEHEEGEEVEHGSEGGLFGKADLLILRPRRRPHNIAILDPDATNVALQGEVVNFNWDTVGAYRVALGYKLGHDWDIAGVYTYVHSNDDQAVGRATSGALYATLSAPFGFDSADAAIGSSGLDMDLIDVEMGKRWIPCEGMELRFVAGSRVATIQQKTEVAYNMRTAGLGVYNANNRMQYDGVGVRVGGESWWRMGGSNLGLFAKGFTSLMTGDFKNSVVHFVNDGRTPIIALNEKFYKVVPVAELGVGLGWKNENVSFSVGYELQNSFGLVDSIAFRDDGSFVPDYHSGDLSLEAITVSLGFTY